MATTGNNKRDVRLGLGIDVDGTGDVKSLAAGVRDLSAAGNSLSAPFNEAAAALDKATAKTRELREAEGAARAEVKADAAALAQKRDELNRLHVTTDSAARKTTEYRAAETALKVALIDGNAALRLKREALSQSATAARTAAAAEAALRSELNAAVVSYRQITAAATTAGDAQRRAASGVEQLKGQLASLRNVAAAALGGTLIGGLARDIGETADAYAGLAARIKIATGDGATFDATFQGVLDIAQRTGTAVDDVGRLFTKLVTAGKQLNLTNADALALTETITQATALSGEAASSSNAAIVQFSQALSAGTLRGEELNSVLEQAPRLARALADGLGVTTGELKKLGETGTLTSAQVIAALQGQSAALQREFNQLPPTIGRAITSLSNNWTTYVGEVDKATGASTTAARAITALGNNLDTIGALLFAAGKAATAYAAINLAKSFLANAAAATASAAAKAADTAATTANTTATVANTAAKASNAAATTAGGVAAAGATVTAGRFAAALSSIKLFALVGVITNFREIGTAIGEGAAKLMGYDKPLRDLEIATRADEQAARANAAAKAELAQKTQLAADAAFGLTDQSRKLVGEFTDVVKKGGESTAALEKLTKALELGSLDGIRNAGVALDDLARRGVLSAAQIRDALSAALKNEDLNVFRINALAAFDDTEQGARRLKVAIDAIAGEALRRAGTSLEELTTGFSKGVTTALNDVDALAESLKELKITGDESGRALAGALDKALSAASTERAVQAVIDRLEELGRQGQISGDQLAAGLAKARTKIDELKPGINSLSEALATFGLQTREQLEGTATKLSDAYRRVTSDARISLADQRKAFDQWSAAAIAANGGVETSAVAVARAMLETKEAALGAGQAGSAAGRAIAASFDAAAASINAAAGSLDGFNAATAARNAGVRSTSAPNTYGPDKYATDSAGQTISIAGKSITLREGQTFDKAAYDRDAAKATVDLDPQRYVRDAPAVDNASQQITTELARLAGIKAQNTSGSAAGAPVLAAPKASTPTPAPTASGSTYVTNVTVGTKVYPITTADKASAQTLLEALEASARSSGF